MGIFPITPLVRQVQGLILQTFDVSEQAAEDYAAELVALAEYAPTVIRNRRGERVGEARAAFKLEIKRNDR